MSQGDGDTQVQMKSTEMNRGKKKFGRAAEAAVFPSSLATVGPMIHFPKFAYAAHMG